MKIQIFEAPDTRTCMKRVRDELGEDAVVLGTETDPQTGVVRVSAAIDYDDASARMLLGRTSGKPAASAAPPAQAAEAAALISDARSFLDSLPADMQKAMTGSQAYRSQMQSDAATPPRGLRRLLGAFASRRKTATATAAAAAPVGTAVTTNSVSAPAPVLATATPDPAAQALAAQQQAGVQHLHAELAAMRRMVERNMQQLTDDRQRSVPARAAALELLEQFGCAAELARDIAADIPPELEREQVLEQTAQLFLARMPLCSGELINAGGIFVLVGPTGAGKTTTAAKLAARYAATHSARDVALIAMDQQRAAASEQLQVHGRRLGVTVLDAHGIDDLVRVLDQASGYPLVIVDTAGMGMGSDAVLAQLAQLRVSHRLQVVPVLPANANPYDLDALLQRLPATMRDAAIITKLDDAGRVGAVLSVAAARRLPIAYSACGQDIQSDLQPASPAILLAQLAQAQARIDHHSRSVERVAA